ncbi:translation initiation factor IF-3 [Candidatus Woesebacteria bacterium]|nr:translation initiation factor IF-3 [Candidatus Woesebacteria bacterium]QQG47247.1 MAG: translation initiation factor IF-3 [Candidatus Woesebacteria bacterium]
MRKDKPNLKTNFKVNSSIQSEKLRVIDNVGKQLGVMSKADALSKAQELNLDLIEIAPFAVPPVAKIINLGKFIYQEEKKKKKENKAKGGELKEVRFSPFIAENDYNTRLERIKEFLNDKSKVRLTVVFRYNQLRGKNFGYELLKKCLKDLEGIAKEEVLPKFLGKNLTMIIAPVSSKKAKENAKTEIKKNINETPQNYQER